MFKFVHFKTINLRSVLAAFTLLCIPVFGQDIVISELLASNGTGIQDEDGAYSDWIELYNNSTTTISLNGWHLSDDAGNLTQWTLPVVTIPTKGYLVIFASNKNRAIAGSELHTNFKLSSGGESVFLTQPNGTTMEDSITFPALDDDVSYGRGLSIGGTTDVLLDQGAACKALVPTATVSEWNSSSFNDSGWTTGTTGVGYDQSTSPVNYNPLIGLNISGMQNNNASAYIRIPFDVTDASSITSLKLKIKFDDAFAAYINGTEVAVSALAPATRNWNSNTGEQYVNDSDGIVFQEFNLTDHINTLSNGSNLLALQAINQSTNSSDILIMPKLEAIQGGVIDPEEEGLLITPTPGSENTDFSYGGVVELPIITPGRGFYDSAIQVVLSNVTAGASIYYTLDGSEPNESSTPYSSPISISTTKNLRVRAYKSGWKTTYPKTDTYIFTGDVVTQSQQTYYINGTAASSTDPQGQKIKKGMDSAVVNSTYYDASNNVVSVQDALKAIPTLSITTDDANLYNPNTGIYVNAIEGGKLWERPASMELIHPDGTEGFHINAGLRIRGGFSRREKNPKHSFRLFFRGEYGDGKLNYPLFGNEGVDSFDKIDLRTSQNRGWAEGDTAWSDYDGGQVKNTFLRDIFGRDTSSDMDLSYTRSRYYHLYLNGDYWGLYMTEERPEATFGAAYYGGDKDDYDTIKTVSRWDPIEDNRNSIEATDGNLDAYYDLYQAAMAGFANNAAYFSVQGLNSSGNPDPTKTKLVDLENLIDYLILISFMDASDNCISAWYGDNKLNNLYGIYNRINPDGFKWFQHDLEWSMDSAFSDGEDFTPNTGDDNTSSGWHRNRTGPFNHANFNQFKWFNPMTLHEKLTANSEYKLAFADRLYKHLEGDGALLYGNNIARIEKREAQIDRAIVAHSARWGNTSLDRDNWIVAVNQMKAWLSGRGAYLISLYNSDGLIPSVARPQLSQADGEVADGAAISLSASAGTIYYTTDGSDPRSIGGGIAGLTYSGAISITRPTHVKARARSGSTWSALAEGTYWNPEIPLAITELMYHAPDGNPHDFIEVQNISDESVAMKSYKFDDGIDFRFKEGPAQLAPGEYMVVVDDIDAFNTTYPAGNITIAGEFSGNFDNNGESLNLEFKNNDLISFSYSDARNWPQAADGAGHSLVPVDSAMAGQERGSLHYGGNWRASTFINGSPGYRDPREGETIVLNEIIAHTDYAPFDSNDKIELYNTSSSSVTLNGWYLSDNLDNLTKFMIPNGTTLPPFGHVVFDENDFHPGRTSGFGLNKAGEQVILSTANRVVDAIRFKGQENGVSLGRYPDGSANWKTTITTPGTSNQLVDPAIRISGVMYHPLPPAGSDMEYIELENTGSSTASLYNPTGPYRIDGGISYTFPAGHDLDSGEKLWLVSFDTANTSLLSQFRSTYGLSGSSLVYGPYKGELSNRGERVALERPQDSDDPSDPLDISWVVLDELFYFDQKPWPTGADGTGYPLIRTGISSWGAVSATDSDADTMLDSWELDFFGSLEQTLPDWDFDGQSNLEEFIAGTHPKIAASYFAVENMDTLTLYWTPETGRTYSVLWSDDLNKPFSAIAFGLTGESYTLNQQNFAEHGYYRIAVELK